MTLWAATSTPLNNGGWRTASFEKTVTSKLVSVPNGLYTHSCAVEPWLVSADAKYHVDDASVPQGTWSNPAANPRRWETATPLPITSTVTAPASGASLDVSTVKSDLAGTSWLRVGGVVPEAAVVPEACEATIRTWASFCEVLDTMISCDTGDAVPAPAAAQNQVEHDGLRNP